MPTSSWRYRAMIYAAVSTIHFYRKDLVPWKPGEKYGSIIDKNKALSERVREEVGNLFNYELSDLQLAKAFDAYGSDGSSITDRPAYTLSEIEKEPA